MLVDVVAGVDELELAEEVKEDVKERPGTPLGVDADVTVELEVTVGVELPEVLAELVVVVFTPPNLEAAEVMLGFTGEEVVLENPLGFAVVEKVPVRVVEEELTTPADGTTGDDPERCILVWNEATADCGVGLF